MIREVMPREDSPFNLLSSLSHTPKQLVELSPRARLPGFFLFSISRGNRPVKRIRKRFHLTHDLSLAIFEHVHARGGT